MGRMLAWLGVAAGAVYLIYIGGGWQGIYTPQLRLATMAMAAIALGAWAIAIVRDPDWRPRSTLVPAIAFALGSLVISTVFSRFTRVSLEYLAYAIVLVALYLLLVQLFRRPFFARRLITLAGMLFVVIAVIYLGQVVVEWVHWWSLTGFGVPPLRPAFGGLTYNNPSAALTMAALLAVPAIAAVGFSTRRRVAAVAMVLVTLAAVALVSGSRSGWFAIGLMIVLAPLVWLSARGNRDDLRARARAALATPGARVFAGITAAALVAATAVALPIVHERLRDGGADLRLAYAVTAVRVFLESPIVGTGPGTWVVQRPQFTVPAETDYYIPHAHNIEVQTLAELGVVGAVAGICLVASLLWLLRGAATSGDRDLRVWAWVAGIGLGYFALHQVLDFYVNMPAFLFASAFPIAYLDARAVDSAVSTAGARWRAGAISTPIQLGGAVAIVVAIAGLVWQELPAMHQAEAVALANNRDWAAADNSARAAVAMDPEIGSYQLTAGLAADRAGDHAFALEQFEALTARNDVPEAWLNLAAEQVVVGNSTGAIDSIRNALRLGFQRPAVAMPAGDLALRLGQEDLAREAFSAAIANAPTLAGDPWWKAAPAREAIFAGVIDQAIRRANPVWRWQIALMSGDADRARGLLDQPGASAFGRILDAWVGDPQAIAAVYADCAAREGELGAIEWCARIAANNGDDAKADTYREMSNIIQLGSYDDGYELRVEPEMSGRQMLGEPADLWATYTYRRPAPWDILVPSLLHLGAG